MRVGLIIRLRFNWKACHVLRLQTGTRFPQGRLWGNRVPTLRPDSGTHFPQRSHWESASHFERRLWDELSAEAPLGKCVPLQRQIPGRIFRFGSYGKPCPTLGANCGTCFPVGLLRETVSRSAAPKWDVLSPRAPIGKVRPISALWPVSCVSSANKKTGWNVMSQPVMRARRCSAAYCCAPSRKKRRLK